MNSKKKKTKKLTFFDGVSFGEKLITMPLSKKKPAKQMATMIYNQDGEWYEKAFMYDPDKDISTIPFHKIED